MPGFVLACVDASVCSRVLSIAAYTKSGVGGLKLLALWCLLVFILRSDYQDTRWTAAVWTRSKKVESGLKLICIQDRRCWDPGYIFATDLCQIWCELNLKNKKGTKFGPQESLQKKPKTTLSFESLLIWRPFLRFCDLSGCKNVFAVI